MLCAKRLEERLRRILKLLFRKIQDNLRPFQPERRFIPDPKSFIKCQIYGRRRVLIFRGCRRDFQPSFRERLLDSSITEDHVLLSSFVLQILIGITI